MIGVLLHFSQFLFQSNYFLPQYMAVAAMLRIACLIRLHFIC